MSNNHAIMPISVKLLPALLGLPAGTKVLAVFQGDYGTDQTQGVCRLLISHPDLDEIPEGALPPVINPQFYDDLMTHWSPGQPAADARLAIETRIKELQAIYRKDGHEPQDGQTDVQEIIAQMGGDRDIVTTIKATRALSGSVD